MTEYEFKNTDWHRGNVVMLNNGREYFVKGIKCHGRYLLLYSEEYKTCFVADHYIISHRTSDYIEPEEIYQEIKRRKSEEAQARDEAYRFIAKLRREERKRKNLELQEIAHQEALARKAARRVEAQQKRDEQRQLAAAKRAERAVQEEAEKAEKAAKAEAKRAEKAAKAAAKRAEKAAQAESEKAAQAQKTETAQASQVEKAVEAKKTTEEKKASEIKTATEAKKVSEMPKSSEDSVMEKVEKPAALHKYEDEEHRENYTKSALPEQEKLENAVDAEPSSEPLRKRVRQRIKVAVTRHEKVRIFTSNKKR